MLDLSKLTDQEVIVLAQAVDLMVESTDIATSDYLAVNTLGNLSTQLRDENTQRWRTANRPAPTRQHTLIIEVPDAPPPGAAPRTPAEWADEVERRITDHIDRQAFIQPRVVEYHRERMINDPDEA